MNLKILSLRALWLAVAIFAAALAWAGAKFLFGGPLEMFGAIAGLVAVIGALGGVEWAEARVNPH